MDSKIHRKSRELEIFALWLEEGVKITRGLEQGLRRAINDFARWQSAERILCRRLPEGLFVGQSRGGKSTPIDPGACLPVICC